MPIPLSCSFAVEIAEGWDLDGVLANLGERLGEAGARDVTIAGRRLSFAVPFGVRRMPLGQIKAGEISIVPPHTAGGPHVLKVKLSFRPLTIQVAVMGLVYYAFAPRFPGLPRIRDLVFVAVAFCCLVVGMHFMMRRAFTRAFYLGRLATPRRPSRLVAREDSARGESGHQAP